MNYSGTKSNIKKKSIKEEKNGYEVGNIFVLAMLVCLLIALIADTVVLSVSPIETNWKKGEVVEHYEKGRVNKYIIAKAVRWAFLWAALVQALTLVFIFINL